MKKSLKNYPNIDETITCNRIIQYLDIPLKKTPEIKKNKSKDLEKEKNNKKEIQSSDEIIHNEPNIIQTEYNIKSPVISFETKKNDDSIKSDNIDNIPWL